MIIDVNAADFSADVLERSKTAPVVVLFWAEWCVPCKTLKPVVLKLANELNFDLALIDAGAGSVADLGVRGVPTLKVFVNGVEVAGFTGARPAPFVRNLLESAGIKETLEFD
jgi:putative thioredoxin